MKIFNRIKSTALVLVAGTVIFSACNKLELDPTPNTIPSPGTTPTLATLLDGSDYSLLKAAVVKADLLSTLADPNKSFTIFAPDNAAINASLAPLLPPGVTPEIYINNVLTVDQVKALISYHIIPGKIKAAQISTAFPNFYYPSNFNPAPSVSALLRLDVYPSVRPSLGAWVNNVPIIGTDIEAVNGYLHKVFRIVQPPSQDLWETIKNDNELNYLEAAIIRADSGVAAGSRLVDAISLTANPSSIASNLTIFAPADSAMQKLLTGAITQALVAKGIPLPQAQFAAGAIVANTGTTLLSNPASLPDIPGIPVVGLGNQLAAVITPTLAKGIVAYHILSSQSGSYAPPGIRVFSVNLPTTDTQVKTLLNSAVAAHPGLTVKASFVSPVPGVSVVAAATVKGLMNTNPSVITKADIHCVNGVIHKINEVLVPQ